MINLQNVTEAAQSGLYTPGQEKDSCGIGFIVNIKGIKSRQIVDDGIQLMKNLEHRGAVGADPATGDGGGILIQMPDEFMRKVAYEAKIELPPNGEYGVGFIFLPQSAGLRRSCEHIIEKIILEEDQKFLGWRKVPVNSNVPGHGAKLTQPYIKQCFIGIGDGVKNQDEFERKLYLIRRVIDHRIRKELKLDRSLYYVPSFSSRTVVYKGMLLAEQLVDFYPDLLDKDMTSALAMVHLRFSTNTFPTWDLAHPFRMIAHNGEINTLQGNKNWMRTKEAVMDSPYYGDDLKRMLPIIMDGQSDSATFDSVLELLVMSGRSLPHAMMMMIPEAYSKNELMGEDRKAFYQYHAMMMEPWDGPAAIAFTDGIQIGATLDRNGLRPARYLITKDDRVILSSEAGVLDIPFENIKSSGKLQPGNMFLVDLKKKRIVSDEEIKNEITKRRPYGDWIKDNLVRLEELPEPVFVHSVKHQNVFEKLKIFGYTRENIFTILTPMAIKGEEPTGSMGTDVPLAVLSERPQPLFRYFKQLFAQVTNPPIDPIREELVMDMKTYVGPEQNLLDETPQHAHCLEINNPVISNTEIEKIRSISQGFFKAHTISILFKADKKRDMRTQLERICQEAVTAVKKGSTLLILSDRGVSEKYAPIPSLLALSAVHQALLAEGLRTRTSIILESGEPREVAHFALLYGYGASAVNPYLVFETLSTLFKEGYLTGVASYQDARKNFVKAVTKGLLKVFSKNGISTLSSYRGAQIFEVVGLDKEVVDKFFTGTSSKIEGMSIEMIEEEALRRHWHAFDEMRDPNALLEGGIYRYRVDGEHHLWNPLTISKLQNATKNNDFKTFKEYTSMIDHQERHRVTLRSLLDFEYAEAPIPIDEVEPASEIVKRFSTGAMSFGSISWEAHTSLAAAMNKIGAKSNTGEGGEDSSRFVVLPGKENLRSAIKQVASGRFGVTANYLVNADELQIKMAQGAKPGEGGQLPGFKVDKIIGRTRHSLPGVTLISPPPHHDIYSIEDLKQLIYDLKNINPKARISVKLVSETGVGTIAAGVAKAHADHILISGHDGGTGASPISSIQYAGSPWELGLSETQQTLVLNGLRDRVYLAVDGQMKTGRDVVIGALLGAEEFGFATAPLVTQGCVMMRKCHLNTCPVGVATQDPELRAKFAGKPEYLVNFMFFIAEEVRELMAKLGFRKFTDMIGNVDKLIEKRDYKHLKARGVDLSKILFKAEPVYKTELYRTQAQHHELESQIDYKFIELAQPALKNKKNVVISEPVKNTYRSLGTLLSGEVARAYGDEGLPDDTITINMDGIAGQSFGAFLAPGITLNLTGQANDYVGKGLSGGKLIISLPEKATYASNENVIAGNTCLYGATSGQAFVNGVVGERFGVRNSGALAVVEGVGDHCCEYMTGGTVVVLGNTGRNFGAGMSGGIAYVYDVDLTFEKRVNKGMVELSDVSEQEDLDKLLELIKLHYEYTKSKPAAHIIKNWETESARFVKVLPFEYKAALERMRLEQQEKIA
jgi:glutamate synthase domain-containing protein 2/glutamate synthase domain-containing protein 1/glutamate synthase domain-containing protein 3